MDVNFYIIEVLTEILDAEQGVHAVSVQKTRRVAKNRNGGELKVADCRENHVVIRISEDIPTTLIFARFTW